MLVATTLNEWHGDHECANEKPDVTKDYSGATGVFSMESDGGTKREFVLETVANGRFVKIPDPSSSRIRLDCFDSVLPRSLELPSQSLESVVAQQHRDHLRLPRPLRSPRLRVILPNTPNPRES